MAPAVASVTPLDNGSSSSGAATGPSEKPTTRAPTRAAKRAIQKSVPDDVSHRIDEPPKKAAKTTFACRKRPSLVASGLLWDAIKDTFENHILGELESGCRSKMEAMFLFTTLMSVMASHVYSVKC